MHFKSQALPCIQVMSIDGRHCQWFLSKPDENQDSEPAEGKGGIKGNQIDGQPKFSRAPLILVAEVV